MMTLEDKIMIKSFRYCLIGIIFFLTNLVYATQELDRIVAIVNKDALTKNELDKGVRKAILFFQENKIDPPEYDVIEKKVLDELIEKKIIEGYAQDFNIVVSQEDINPIIDNLLDSNEITIEEFKDSLLHQETSYDEFISGLTYEILLKKVKNREISSKLVISDFEIQKHKEKLSQLQPDLYDISHILLKFPSDPSTEDKNNKRNLGAKIFKKLDTDKFEKLAYEFSDAPDANQGGSLGKLKKNELPEVFIEKIKNLKPGEYTEPFESNNGVHILKINSIDSFNESKNNSKEIKKYFVRQIVLKTSEIQSETDVIKKLKRFKNEINSGANFSIIAKKYSEDFSSQNGGELGWISEGIDSFLDTQLSKIDKDEISDPFQTSLGWHIIQYTDYKFENMSKENIDTKIKRDLIEERTELIYEDWYSTLKAESFIEIRNE